jgi:PTS system mannose-specific IIA component
VARDAIALAIEKVDRGRGVLLLTDMFGGTPSNLGLSFLEAGRIDVVTGANLPMLIKLAKITETGDLTAISREICEHGRAAIRVASDLLRADSDLGPSGS